MKLVACMTAMMLCACMAVAGGPRRAKAADSKPINPAYGIARGFANVVAGWLEIPRGLVYENARIPVVGFLTGPVKGAFLTTWRELAGVTDVLAFGLTGKGLYYKDIVPDFVWDAQWIPPTNKTYVNPEQGNIPLEPKKGGTGRKKGGSCAQPCKKPCPPPCGGCQ